MNHMGRMVGLAGVMALGLSGGVEARSIAVPTPSVPWVIESADYSGKVTEQIARFQTTLAIKILQDGWVEVPLALSGATITKIELAKRTSDAQIMPKAGSYVLGASRKGTYKVAIEFAVRLAQDSQYEGVEFSIPQASFSTLSLVVPKKDVELRPAEQLYVERVPNDKGDGVLLKASLGSTERVDMRWSTRPAAPVKVEPLVYGEINTLAVLEEQLAHLTCVIDYQITQGETRELNVRLPKDFQVLNVRGAGIEAWRLAEDPEARVLDVKLNFPLKDAVYRLVVEGEHTLPVEQAAYQLPEVTLPGVKQERGQLAIATSGNLEVSAGTLEGLTRIDTKEVSDTLRTATVFPILMAFRYHQHPYQASLTLTRYKDLPVLNAVAEQGELISVLSRQGELLTRAAYVIRANKKQFLGVRLPGSATLWSCIVDGRLVKPVEGANGQLLVPLATARSGEQPVVAELVYFEQRPTLRRMGKMTLTGPVLDVPTTIANWLVYAPKQVQFLRTSGNLEKGLSVSEFVSDPFTAVAYADAGERNAGLQAGAEVAKRAHRPLTLAFRGEAAGRIESSSDSFGANFSSGTGTAAGLWSGGGGNAAEEKQLEAVLSNMAQRMQEAGIFPLKIRLPKTGKIYRFNRLMTSQEALELNAWFLNLPATALPAVVLVGILLLASGGLTFFRYQIPRRDRSKIAVSDTGSEEA